MVSWLNLFSEMERYSNSRGIQLQSSVVTSHPVKTKFTLTEILLNYVVHIY